MNTDVETLIAWIRGFLWVAAVSATAFPLLYAFSPWFKSTLGRCIMGQSLSLALAIDVTLLFQYWDSAEQTTIFWINLFVFGSVAAATSALTCYLWRVNYKSFTRKRRQK